MTVLEVSILELLVGVLFVGFFYLLIFPGYISSVVATGASFLGLIIGIHIMYHFDKSVARFQAVRTYTFEIGHEYFFTFSLGVDGLSMVFLLLTLFVFPVCFLAA